MVGVEQINNTQPPPIHGLYYTATLPCRLFGCSHHQIHSRNQTNPHIRVDVAGTLTRHPTGVPLFFVGYGTKILQTTQIIWFV